MRPQQNIVAMIAGFSHGVAPLVARLREALETEVPRRDGCRVADIAVEFYVRKSGRVDVFFHVYPELGTRRPEPLFCANSMERAPERRTSDIRFGIVDAELRQAAADSDGLESYCLNRASSLACRLFTFKDHSAAFRRGFSEICWAFRHLTLDTPPILRDGDDDSPWTTVEIDSDEPV
ncbi:MAG: hypothetical protein PHI63_05700 [Patescibacteria group bacterium]|nr:hypothetical protein [Patescibacteria group bacterium]